MNNTIRPGSQAAIVYILVALIAGASFVYGKKIEVMHHKRASITVQGEGKMTAVPDIATLNFGVQTGRQKTADRAMTMLSERMERVMQAVQAVGVEERDIKNQHLSLNPAYDWDEGERRDRGFEANQTLIVKVRDLEKITNVLDAAIKAGANQAGNIQFTIDEPDDLKAEARSLAIADAKDKAKELAAELNVTLGALTGFSEQGQGGSPVYMQEAMMMDARGIGGGGASPPIPAGEQDIQVTVSLTYTVK